MRKIFLSLLVAATSLSLLASEETVGGVLFEVDNVTKTAVVKANNYSGHLYIPDVINEDVEVVGVSDDAFTNCADLQSIRFSRNIFTLNGGIFTGCTSLKTVIIPAAEGIENVITFVGSAGSFPFDELAPEQLYALCLSKEVKFVDKVSQAEVTDYSSFYNTLGLKMLAIGNRVSKIGENAFKNSKIKSILCQAQEPPVCASTAFEQSRIKGEDWRNWCVLMVPNGALSAYQTADVWKDIPYKNQPYQAQATYAEPQVISGDSSMLIPSGLNDPNNLYVTMNGGYYSVGKFIIYDLAVDTLLFPLLEAGADSKDMENMYRGMMMKIPAGTGYLEFDAVNDGYHHLTVAIEGQDIQFFKVTERDTIKVPFDVKRESKVYIFSSMPNGESVGMPPFRMPAASGGQTNIYGIGWHVDKPILAIDAVASEQNSGVKIIRDGQLYIMYEGTMYNVQGAKVK